MKIVFVLIALISSYSASSKEGAYHGSTPAGLPVRAFLGISLTDSIDFIRWQLDIRANSYVLDCRYGIGKPNTNGFIDEKKAAFSGSLTKQGNYYRLQHANKTLYIIEVNANLLHVLDENRNLLIGNGGWSYALNSKAPAKSTQFNYAGKKAAPQHLMAFQGRTPCREISSIIGLKKSAECIKMKWYVMFFTDSATGRPAYYLQGGRNNRERGQWEIIQKNGRTLYKLSIQKNPNPFYLLSADDKILFFTDAEGNLLVGNDDFSYTLNRTE